MAAKASFIFGFECEEPREYWLELNDRWFLGRRPQEPLTENYQSPEWVAYRKLIRTWEAESLEHIQILRNNLDGSDSVYFLEVAPLRRECPAGSVLIVNPPTPLSDPLTTKCALTLSEFCDFAAIPCREPRWYVANVERMEIK